MNRSTSVPDLVNAQNFIAFAYFLGRNRNPTKEIVLQILQLLAILNKILMTF